jgi:hypothetical protein
MGKRDDLYRQLSAPDGVAWPDESAAREVAAMDSVIADNLHLLTGSLTESGQHSIPGKELRDREERMVAQFRALTNEQRSAVTELARTMCSDSS